MRKVWNGGWQFTKSQITPGAEKSASEQGVWEAVELPHTWNGVDGQDGGNDYHRGMCYYRKTLKASELAPYEEAYIEFCGTNSSADLYVNGKKLAHHDGGYSTWRCNITDALVEEENEIIIGVDNAPNDFVYPQRADFTFYGGIYRDVALWSVGRVRFDLDCCGGPGIDVTPTVKGKDAEVAVRAYLSGVSGREKLEFFVLDEGRSVVSACAAAADPSAVLQITDVHLWDGRRDPHLYELRAVLYAESGCILDERTVRFGCRSFAVDAEKGFLLNGRPYPLHGVSRHQDRPGKGNALTQADHQEDMALICEMGANTIRLAHYQHDQYFYDLCDEKGMIVWAEIPYISRHLAEGDANTVSQMTELIRQNYNHPSIVVWGLSNEITMANSKVPGLVENHRALNQLCHELDPTRLTAVAAVAMCDIDDEYLRIPDVVSYNLYYGWYGGTFAANGEFLDKFHEKYPETPIGISEYGCDALNWHNSEPRQGDYTEEYQAIYHEELIRQLFQRPYVWATHVWNMFDFAADARSEGGEDGINHKGLVTFDRKYKKDAFYAYKAWLSDEPFVHLCGKRYIDRTEPVTKVTVYSNQPEVELFVNEKSLGVQASADHFFYFSVPNEGESTLTAVAGDCRDEGKLRRVETFNEAYRMKETGGVINWLDITAPDGYCSINDRMSDVMATLQGKLFVMRVGLKLMRRKKADDRKSGKKKSQDGFKIDEGLLRMMENFTVKRMFGMMESSGFRPLSQEEILSINRKLNKIKKK